MKTIFAKTMSSLLALVATLTLATGAGTAHAAGCDPKIPVTGDIGAKWLQLKGASGVLGCPVGPARPLQPQQAFTGTEQFFQNGHIVRSPNQGQHMVVAAYRKGGTAYVSWGNTAPFSYDKFQIRFADTRGAEWVWSRWQVEFANPDGYKQSGSYSRTGAPGTTISFTIQGCDHSAFGTTCRQGWTYPVHVRI